MGACLAQIDQAEENRFQLERSDHNRFGDYKKVLTGGILWKLNGLCCREELLSFYYILRNWFRIK